MKKTNSLIVKRSVAMMIFLGLFLSASAHAEDALDYSESAKNRAYLGGAEESDLKVLPESYFLKNKKNSTEEVNEGF